MYPDVTKSDISIVRGIVMSSVFLSFILFSCGVQCVSKTPFPASAPVMGYAIAMPQHSHATAISPRNGHYHVMPNRVPSYRIPEPPMKVF